MTAFSFKEEFSVLKCLKKIKIIFLSPDSFTFHCCWSARYKRFYNFSILFYSCLKTHLMAFLFETHTAISAFRAMLINYIYFPYLFKSNTMQRVSPIINSQRQPNLEKSEYRGNSESDHLPPTVECKSVAPQPSRLAIFSGVREIVISSYMPTRKICISLLQKNKSIKMKIKPYSSITSNFTYQYLGSRLI